MDYYSIDTKISYRWFIVYEQGINKREYFSLYVRKSPSLGGTDCHHLIIGIYGWMTTPRNHYVRLRCGKRIGECRIIMGETAHIGYIWWKVGHTDYENMNGALCALFVENTRTIRYDDTKNTKRLSSRHANSRKTRLYIFTIVYAVWWLWWRAWRYSGVQWRSYIRGDYLGNL